MTVTAFKGFPRQQLSYKQKSKKWGKKCVDMADAQGSLLYSSSVRNSVRHKKINRDLVNMHLHTEDIARILNPNNLITSFTPDKMQHYPTINAYLELLRGEAISRPFEWSAIVTNPNAISDIENTKKEKVLQSLQSLIEDQSISEEDYNKKIQEQSDYFTYNYQDMREIRANRLLKHYSKEKDFKNLFDTEGIMDVLMFNEEHYYIDIVSGEPSIEKINPEELRIYRSGNSNRTEDADLIVWETYKSIGWVYDTYGDVLSKKDCNTLEKIGLGDDEEEGTPLFSNTKMIPLCVEDDTSDIFDDLLNGYDDYSSGLPYDKEGNVRVLRVFWKSRRKLKKVKKYDFNTGEEEIHFYPETYVANKYLGEEEEELWINEAWEGTKIGENIYVNVRPRPIQYNSLSCPSRCHFGIIGQMYNIGNSPSPSIVDILKPYAYNYDITMDKLYKLIDSDLGKLTIFDAASIPDSWKVEKWLYFAKKNHIAIRDSFNEGKKGSATGKLYGAMNNNTTGVIDASLSNQISFHIELLNWIDTQMGKVCGITPQRLGQISNRETVGGVERSTLQSSHITESIFAKHDNLKKRVLEAFIEASKIAAKGKNIKFEYILSNGSKALMTIDGDEYAECDYGIVVDNSQSTMALMQKLDGLAQAGLQNQMFNFSTLMKLYSTDSIAEKTKMMEDAEKKMQEMQQQQHEQEMQLQQQQAQMEMEQKQLEMQQREDQNKRDNDTRIIVAQIQAQANIDSSVAKASGYTDTPIQPISEKERAELNQKIREAEQKYEIDKEKIKLEREKIRSKK